MAISLKSPINALKPVSHLFNQANLSNISISLILASLAVLLRPTSIITCLLLLPSSFSLTLFLRAIIIGPTTLIVSIALDTLYFRRPTFPAWNFIQFNFLEELSVFYGSMSWHYYLSQG